MAQTASSAEQPKSLESVLDSMTPSELKVLSLIASGASNGAIAKRMTISGRSVGNYVNSIYSQLQISDDQYLDQRARAAFLYWEVRPQEKKQLQDRLFENQKIEPLTSREYEVLFFIAQGYSNDYIARRLSIKSIYNPIRYIYGKLNVESYEGTDPRAMAMLMFDRVPVPSGYNSRKTSVVPLVRK